MPRRPRLQFPGAIYHVMSRGNRRLRIFDDDEDRAVFMTTLGEAAHRYSVRLYAWCLMPNHYHLVLDTPRANLSDAMRHLNGVFTQTANRMHQRSGHVFEGRFRSLVVQQQSYLRRVTRYVVLNPVRARLVAHVADWKWSSFRATAGLEPAPPGLSLDWLTLAFPNTQGPAVDQYVNFVTSVTARKETLSAPRGVLGSPSFEREVREAVRGSRPDHLLPISHRALGRPTLDELFGSAMGAVERNRRIIRAHVEYGYRLTAIAHALRVHPSTVSLVVRRWQPVAPVDRVEGDGGPRGRASSSTDRQ